MKEKIKKVGKDKLTPQQIGKTFVEILLETRVIDFRKKEAQSIVELIKDHNPRVSLGYIEDKLFYLDIYLIYQVILSRFKAYLDKIDESFKNELEKSLKQQKSEKEALTTMINVNKTLVDYMEKYNNTIAGVKNADASGKLAEFSHYIAKRVFGRGAGDDIRYVIYITGYCTDTLTSLADFIDNSIELIPKNQNYEKN